jgi:hypothetical protein
VPGTNYIIIDNIYPAKTNLITRVDLSSPNGSFANKTNDPIGEPTRDTDARFVKYLGGGSKIIAYLDIAAGNMKFFNY